MHDFIAKLPRDTALIESMLSTPKNLHSNDFTVLVNKGFATDGIKIIYV